MRVAIYARTSTNDGRQDLSNQTRELHAYAERMGWTVVAEFHDQVSGRKSERPELKKALEAGRKRRYDVLLFWSLDRLSRQGVLATLLLLNQLSHYGVRYRSLQEQWIDSLGAFSDAVIGVLATVAKLEAERISCRVRSGLERARSQGKVLGRPRVVVDHSRIVRLRDQGLSLREIAAKTGKSTMTVQRSLKAREGSSESKTNYL